MVAPELDADHGAATQGLLDWFARAAAKPVEATRTLPPAAYRDPGLYALEQERVFGSAWLCVAHRSQVARPGDRLAAQAGGEPVLVLRDREGRVRAFSNVCRHRNARLACGAGSGRLVVCPYHGWSYDLTGALVAAPHLALETLSETDRRLPEFDCVDWMGWIYVSLHPHPAPFAPAVAGLASRLEPYAPAEMSVLWSEAFSVDVNWKCFVENFSESYHVSVVHRDTVHRSTPTSGVRCAPGGPGFACHELAISPADGAAEAEPQTEVLACIFPTHLLSVTPGVALWVTLDPAGPERVEAVMSVAVSDAHVAAQGGDREALAARSRAYAERFNAEDKAVLANVFAGLRARHAVSGPIAPLERPIAEFVHYLAEKLAP